MKKILLTCALAMALAAVGVYVRVQLSPFAWAGPPSPEGPPPSNPPP
jgi:hypothetical protein